MTDCYLFENVVMTKCEKCTFFICIEYEIVLNFIFQFF